MQKKNFTALKLSLSAAAALALTFGAVTPAFAADVQIGPGAVAGFENGTEGTAEYNYDQWHVGNTENPDAIVDQSLTFNECSVTTLPAVERDVTQLLKGFPIDSRPTTDGTTAPLEALVNSTSITVLSGSVTVQIPMFILIGGDPADLDFTTYRSVTLNPGTYNLADLEITDSTGWPIGSNFAETFDLLQTFIEEDGHIFQILGVGFTGSAGAEVSTLSFGGDTFYFGTGACAPVTAPTPAVPGAATPPIKIETAA
ncbi:MAG: hypothetical protein ACTIJ6_05210 [Leucobacter sp.]